MVFERDNQLLDRIAFLFLLMAHGIDEYLTDSEMDVIALRLSGHWTEGDYIHAREIVVNVLPRYTATAEPFEPACEMIEYLGHVLLPDEKTRLLEDLAAIAGADGVTMERERGLIRQTAERWGIEWKEPAAATSVDPDLPRSGVALAYVFILTAHGTDSDLSEEESRTIIRKLQNRFTDFSEDQVQAIYNRALRDYAGGPTDEKLVWSNAIIVRSFSESDRMELLSDLVQLANADGYFLDNEEDLLNQFMSAWRVPAYSNYYAGRLKATGV